MRVSFLIAILLAVAPSISLACSCAGTQSIGAALASAEAVVLGKVKLRTPADYSPDHPRPAALVVEIIDSLKGNLKGKIEIAEGTMCYQSFTSDEFQVGASYIFPLTEIDLTDPRDTFDLLDEPAASSAPPTMYRLPVCSHTALLLEGEKLYANELTSSGGRQLEPYMNLFSLNVLFATGLYDVRRAMVLIATTVLLLVAVVVVRRRRAKSTHGV